MKGFDYLAWFRRLLVLGAVVAIGATATAAGAAGSRLDPGGPDSTPAGLKADGLRWQGIAATYKQLENASHFPTAQGLKADGLRLQGIAATYKQLENASHFPTAQGMKADGLRLQGIAQVYQQLEATPSSSGFDWNDWGIGIGTGVGMALILGGCLVMGRQLRHRDIQTA
jgi:hypothetical protein